ncbi:divalent cation tolerance protein CutA [Streptomyces sp. NPDC005931]|uniref:divalent cation tolerance protein CutA n=1 Tax=Streptomyces sp. NPDC005931 TaxID=3364737 RepID=UPI00368ACE8D
MADFLQMSTATPTREQAVELARTVVQEKLAAGAQIIGPVTSAFWHNGEFGAGKEWQLLLKCPSSLDLPAVWNGSRTTPPQTRRRSGGPCCVQDCGNGGQYLVLAQPPGHQRDPPRVTLENLWQRLTPRWCGACS